ncbi:MAG: GNAT family N-acetyltransferase [Chitinophagaceae bacterium]
MTIMPATTADIPALNTLINSAYRGETSKKGWTTEADLLDGIRTDPASLLLLLQKQDAVMLTARAQDGTITGCMFLEKQQRSFYLGMLTVDPQLQAGGIGGQLLLAAEAYVQQANVYSIRMTVISVRFNLIAWYERHGYKKTGETQPFPSDPAFGTPRQPLEFLVLEKELGEKQR